MVPRRCMQLVSAAPAPYQVAPTRRKLICMQLNASSWSTDSHRAPSQCWKLVNPNQESLGLIGCGAGKELETQTQTGVCIAQSIYGAGRSARAFPQRNLCKCMHNIEKRIYRYLCEYTYMYIFYIYIICFQVLWRLASSTSTLSRFARDASLA